MSLKPGMVPFTIIGSLSKMATEVTKLVLGSDICIRVQIAAAKRPQIGDQPGLHNETLTLKLLP